MPSREEQLNRFLDILFERRDARIEMLPEVGDFVDVIADAMNALQVAYVTVLAATIKETPQEATFTPVSNPGDSTLL